MRNLFRKTHSPTQRGAGGALPPSAYLARTDLFKDLTMNEIEVLFRGLMLQECKPGTIFFTPEDSAERLFVLKEGHVELYRLTASGKRLVIRHIEPGTVFGEMGLLGQTLHGCFAEASESSLVCTATRADVLRVMQQHPDVALRLFEVLGKRLRLLEDHLEHVALHSVRERLADFLLANADPATHVVGGHTQTDIGDSIGALRQTVAEALGEMQREGLIEVGHKRIRILDRERMAQLATGESA